MLDLYKALFNKFGKERNGSITIETTVAFPFMVIVVAIMLFFCVIVMCWINYGSFAQNLAENLNFHQTGLERAQYLNDTSLSQVRIIDGAGVSTLQPNQLEVHVYNDNGELDSSYYRNAVIYSILDNAKQLAMPYSHVQKIIVSVYREGANNNFSQLTTDNAAANFAGAQVEVRVIWDFARVGVLTPASGSSGGAALVIPGFEVQSVAHGSMI